VLKAEELADKATRSRTNKLKQLETEARRRRVDVSRHTIAIDRELARMQSLVWPA
jgi:post-segregation antitoxin (ccd killing protein)